MQHIVNFINYLLYGNGKYMTRWECTSHDIYFLFFTVVGCSWMAIEYYIYGSRTFQAKKYAHGTYDRRHKVLLSSIFVFCATIHLLNTVVPWVITPYYFLSSLYWCNALFAHWLNKSKLQLLADQEFRLGREAQISLFRIGKVLNDPALSIDERIDLAVKELQAMQEILHNPTIPADVRLRIALNDLDLFLKHKKD